MGFLEDICEQKRAEVASRRKVMPASALAPHPAARRHGFLESLSRPGIRLVCEVKRASPSEGAIAGDDDIVKRAHTYRAGGAAAISVLTDGLHFGGSLDDLRTLREEVSVPLLRKDFVVDAYQVAEAESAGANAVLLIVAALDQPHLRDLYQEIRGRGMEALVEVHDARELERAVDLGARVIGINNRNLKTLEVDLATCRALLPTLPGDCVGVAESGISSYAEVEELHELGARAFLIGTSLMRSPDVAATLRALQGREATPA